MDELGNREKQEVGTLGQQQGGEQPPAVPTTRTGDDQVQEDSLTPKVASVHANLHNHFSLERHLIDRRTYKQRRSAALAEWQVLAS